MQTFRVQTAYATLRRGKRQMLTSGAGQPGSIFLFGKIRSTCVA